MKYPRAMETGYLNAGDWHPSNERRRGLRGLDRKCPAFRKGRLGVL
jgi:hypothetical protein